MTTKTAATATAKRELAAALNIPVAQIGGNARWLQARVENVEVALAAVPGSFTVDGVKNAIFVNR